MNFLFLVCFLFVFVSAAAVVLWFASLRWWLFCVLMLFLLFCLQEVKDGGGLICVVVGS